MGFVRSRPLVSFFGLAFGFTWTLAALFWLLSAEASQPRDVSIGIWLGVYLASWGPTLSAFAVALICGGGAEVIALGQKILRRAPLRWWILALGIPIAISLASAGVTNLFIDYPLARLLPPSVPELAIFLVATTLSGPLGEEFGWRGFALPRLGDQVGVVKAVLIIGAAWYVWHLPGFVVPHLQQLLLPRGLSFIAFGGFIIGGSIISAWLYLGSGQALGIPMLFHLGMLTATLAVQSGAPAVLVWSASLLYLAIAAVLLITKSLPPSQRIECDPAPTLRE